MYYKKIFTIGIALIVSVNLFAGNPVNPYKPDSRPPKQIKGYKLVWHDEFNNSGAPDSSNWSYENGFVRNRELQWYQPQNAYCKNGVLKIVGEKERIKNPDYLPNSPNWKLNCEYAEYSSASINTAKKHSWTYGRFEIRARIPAQLGTWPAIWTLGTQGRWPACGEIDLMEYYPVHDSAALHANVATKGDAGKDRWFSKVVPLTHFTEKDSDWVKKFHVWRMDWDKDSIKLFIDDELINSVSLKDAVNFDGSKPFEQPQYLLLNLALGSNGGDLSGSQFPLVYEVDYVRVYQKK
jgi:beta-glucanase (GH16 family)